jgi:predicted metal-dependent phosphoesterase TrpH
MLVSSVPTLTVKSEAADTRELLRELFSSVDEASCPTSYNFHMHTHCSDGRLAPAALMEQAFQLKLKGFAITDHHTVAGYLQAKRWLEDWQWRHPARLTDTASQAGAAQSATPRLFIGLEVTAALLEVEVHILGYGFNPQHHAMQPYLQRQAPSGENRQAAQVIHSIQAAGGLAVLAHPGRYRRSATELIQAAAQNGIDGVETYYAYGNPDVWVPCPKQTPLVKSLAQRHQLLTTCGTDTHGLNLTRRL